MTMIHMLTGAALIIASAASIWNGRLYGALLAVLAFRYLGWLWQNRCGVVNYMWPEGDLTSIRWSRTKFQTGAPPTP